MQVQLNKNLPNVEYDLELLNNALYINLFTNVTKRPIKLLVDTGAVITLVASDVIMDFTPKLNCVLDLCGVTGSTDLIQTRGAVNGYSMINNNTLGTTMHLVDRKYAGPADGYLGFDFLSQYRTIIDMNEKKIYFKLGDDEKTRPKIEINPDHINKEIEFPIEKDDFLEIIGNAYDFSETTNYAHDNPKNEFKQYFNAIKHFKQKFEERENDKPFMLSEMICNNDTFLHPMPIFSTTSNYTIGLFHNFDDWIKDVDTITDFDLDENNVSRIRKIIQDIKMEHCSPNDKQFIWTICAAFPNQFYLDGDILGSTDIIRHEINLIPNAKPVNLRQYRIPHSHKQALDKIIADYGRQGIIEKCTSNFNSPVILVDKKNDNGEMTDFRLVVDYRKLNEITESANFPIPSIDEILDGLSGCKYFTTMDIKGAFHQILMEESSRDYTAFTAGNFQYR